MHLCKSKQKIPKFFKSGSVKHHIKKKKKLTIDFKVFKCDFK